MNSNDLHQSDRHHAAPESAAEPLAAESLAAHSLRDSVAHWLELEVEAGDLTRAEASAAELDGEHLAAVEGALARVMVGLPELVPSAGFAARVLAARAQSLGALSHRAVLDLDKRWRVLTAVVLGLGALALARLAAPLGFALLALQPMTWPRGLIDGLAVALSRVVQLVAAMVQWADHLAAVGRAVSAVVLAPPSLIFLLFSTFLTLVIGRWLVRTLTVQRSPAHG